MKKYSSVLLLSFLFLFNHSFSQTGWFFQNSSSTSSLKYVCFPSDSIGYIAGFGTEIIKTTNGGNNWFHLNCNISIDILCTSFANNEVGWIAGTNGVLCYTTNGGNLWMSQSSGVTTHLYAVGFINANTGFVTSDGGKILKTTNGGLNWSLRSSNTTKSLTSIFFVNATTGWITGDNGVILKSTNGGENWFSQSQSVLNNIGRVFFVNPQTGWITGTGGILLNTTNGGDIWNFQQSSTPNWIISPFFISSTTGWIAGAYGTILKTTNSGLNWFSQNSNTNSTLICAHFLNSQTGFIVGDNGTILKTTNGGLTLPPAPVLLYPPNQSVNIPLTPAMTWGTVNGALSYKIQISTIPNFNIITDSATVINNQYPVPGGKLQNGITYFWRVFANTNLGATTWSDVWYFSTASSSIIQISTIIPPDYKLYSNYPNPFNPATKIKFDLPKKSHASLIVYNALGKTVETLVNSELKEGSYEYTWSAEKYNSGVFFIRMVSDKYFETKRMILLK